MSIELPILNPANVAPSEAGNKALFVRESDGKLVMMDATGNVEDPQASTGGGGGGYTAPTYTADITAGRAIAAADLANKVLVYNSAANGNFTIPDDATLSLTGNVAASFEIYQKGTGRPDIVAGVGVTVNAWAGYPTSTQYVTQTVHRVGPNTWAVK